MDAQAVRPCVPVFSIGREIYEFKVIKKRKKKINNQKEFNKDLDTCKKAISK